MKISFTKHVAHASFLSPLKNFEMDSQEVESRVDPLTGQPAIIRTGRKFWHHQYTTDRKVLAETAEQTREGCFFCPEKVTTVTPRYPDDFIPGGRITVGETTFFPNLFAQKEHSAVAVVTRQHFVPLDRFTPGLLHNAFKACALYLKRLAEGKPPKFLEIGFNYLFPAGASIPHPHIQIMGGVLPTFLVATLLSNARRYHAEKGTCYWSDLLSTEQEIGTRYIGRIGNVDWLTPFAAQREDEVHGVVRNRSNFLQFEDDDWRSLAEGISRVFRYYSGKDLSSCNFAIFSGPLDENLDCFWAGIRLVSRTSVKAKPLNDVWFSQNVLYDGLVTEPPEDIAAQVRKYF